jgi:hypothetical protein
MHLYIWEPLPLFRYLPQAQRIVKLCYSCSACCTTSPRRRAVPNLRLRFVRAAALFSASHRTSVTHSTARRTQARQRDSGGRGEGGRVSGPAAVHPAVHSASRRHLFLPRERLLRSSPLPTVSFPRLGCAARRLNFIRATAPLSPR